MNLERILGRSLSQKMVNSKREIPRGQFYAYFHDKEDLYHYILEEYRTQIRSLSFILV